MKLGSVVEIGVLGFPYRVAAIATGLAVSAEADGADAVWFPDLPVTPLPVALWREAAGPLADVIPDPTDQLDPCIAATVALLSTRRSRVGVLALDPSTRSRESMGRALATMAELAPGRVIASIHAAAGTHESVAAVVSAVRAVVEPWPELVIAGMPSADLFALAETCDAGWLAMGPASAEVVRGAAACPHPAGIMVPVVAHADDAIARKALGGPLLSALAAKNPQAAEGLICGTPTEVVDALRAYVDVGVTRIVLDNLLALGAPEELEGGRAATRAIVRAARLTFRSA